MDTGLKKEILEKLMAADDDELFSMVQEDIALYEISKTKDVTDGLSAEDFAELKDDINIPLNKNSITYDEFKESISRWLTK